MNETQQKVFDKIEKMFEESSIEWKTTPDKLDYNCGHCTGDKAYNKDYRTGMKEAGEYIFVDNSCQSYLLDGNLDKVRFGEENARELRELVIEVRNAIKEQEERDKKDKEELEKILKE